MTRDITRMRFAPTYSWIIAEDNSFLGEMPEKFVLQVCGFLIVLGTE